MQSVIVFYIILCAQIGTYNPLPNKDNIKEVTASSERVQYWLSVGAQPSERVSYLLGSLGVIPMRPHRLSVESAIPKEFRQKDAKKK
jgi:small subunit ribosomal protein S16